MRNIMIKSTVHAAPAAEDTTSDITHENFLSTLNTSLEVRIKSLEDEVNARKIEVVAMEATVQATPKKNAAIAEYVSTFKGTPLEHIMNSYLERCELIDRGFKAAYALKSDTSAAVQAVTDGAIAADTPVTEYEVPTVGVVDADYAENA